MNIAIDIGNTRVKLGVFSAENKYVNAVLKEEVEDELNFIFSKYDSIYKSIVSASGKIDQKWINLLKEKTQLHVFSPSSKVPFISNYTTPKTLGLDRKALVAAASVDFPLQNVLVIDLGTCITYDFIDCKNCYHGGAISPGIKMRFESMNNFTENLPLIKKDAEDHKFKSIGNSTENALSIGVFEGIIYEIQGFVRQYRRQFHDLTVILCGGDANLLAGRLKNSIFANSNFQLKGLNHILEQNTN